MDPIDFGMSTVVLYGWYHSDSASVLLYFTIDFGSLRPKFTATLNIYGNKLVNTINTKPLCVFFVKLSRHFNHDEMMNPIYFGGQRSKVKVTKTYMLINL